MMKKILTTPTDGAMLIPAPAAAELFGVSRSFWLKQVSAGKVPAPIRIGRAVRWNRDELIDWIRAGCPARQKWEAMRQ